MDFLKSVSVTSVNCPVIIRSKKGDNFQMKDRECYGLSFCTSGQITYTMNGKNIISSPDRAILLPKGASYSLTRDKDGLFPLINFHCINCDVREICVLELENPAICIKNFEILQNMFLKNESRLKIMSAFYSLLESVFEASEFKPTLIKSAEGFIEKNISNHDLTNRTIADHLNISEIYLRKLFNKYHKTTPKQFLLEKRMQKAMYLLTNTPMNVTSISFECGFSSVYHFSRSFSQHTGYTPTQYYKKTYIDYINDNTYYI